MSDELVSRVTAWIAGDPDETDRQTLELLLAEGATEELARRFAAPLRFGTAGLRGPVMAGAAGMNRYTVRRATQGVAAWLLTGPVDAGRGVVVGRDARRGSELFNDEVVAVLLGAGIPVYEMPGPLPTPLVAFAVRELSAAAGIMITASHNPPGDNGYKLYDVSGSQIIGPDDEIVERFAAAASMPNLGTRDDPRYHRMPAQVIEEYHRHALARFAPPAPSALRIVYTPLHGVGGATMTSLLREAGYRAISVVAEQFEPDGRFPTLPFPNPEEPGALDRAIARADEVGADLVLANDPDADRLGVAAREGATWRVLRGDQIGWLLASVLLPEAGVNDVVATSIVSSMMLESMARDAGVAYVTTLTGFKWIARAAGNRTLAFGYEEALGFAVDARVADKDGLTAALALARLADELAGRGETLLDRLDAIEERYGVHVVDQLSIRDDGPGGRARIVAAVERLREDPPHEIGGLAVDEVVDLAAGGRGLPPTNGVVLVAPPARVVVRPSGTEAKLKAYLEVVVEPGDERPLDERRRGANTLLAAIRDDLGRRLALARDADR